MPETEVKNADQARAFINDYIARNINETPMHLVLTKRAGHLAGSNALNSRIPPAIESSTRFVMTDWWRSVRERHPASGGVARVLISLS